MNYSNAKLDSIKKSFAESGIRYDTDDEYIEAMHNLVGFFDVLIQMDLQQKEAERAKKDTPEKLSETY